MPEEVRPVNRKEAIIAGENVTPVTREEAILKKESVTPLSREEYYLKELADGQGGGLEYVIPEQTVMTASEPVSINSNQLVPNQTYVLKYIESGTEQYGYAKAITLPINPNETSVELELHDDRIVQIAQESGETKIMLYNLEYSPVSMTITISAIRGF